MDDHSLNVGIIGDICEGDDPELKASPILADGVGEDDDLVLGTVEYLAQEPESELFHGDAYDGHWVLWPPNSELFALHAWMQNHNPEGIFHTTNPREQFSQQGCVGGDH